MACGMCTMRTSVNPALDSARILNSFAMKSLSGLTSYGHGSGYGLGATDQASSTPVTDASQAAAQAGTKFNWQGLIDQGFNFAEKFITLRPAQGTVVTRGPGGQIQVARGADGQPIAYNASNTQIGGNVGGQFGAGLGLQAQGLNTNMLLIGGVLLVGVVLMSRR